MTRRCDWRESLSRKYVEITYFEMKRGGGLERHRFASRFGRLAILRVTSRYPQTMREISADGAPAPAPGCGLAFLNLRRPPHTEEVPDLKLRVGWRWMAPLQIEEFA
jgi:hypothetical protein